MGYKPETFSTPGNPIKFRGVFDEEKVFQAIVSWMKAEQMQVFVPSHKDKESGGLRECEIKIEGIVKWDEYLKFQVDAVLHSFDVQNVTVEQNGKQVKLQQGRIEFELKGTFTQDYAKAFGGEWWHSFLNKYLIWSGPKDPTIKPKSDGFKKIASLNAAIRKALGDQV